VSNNTVEIYRGTVENIRHKGEFNTVNIFGGSVTNMITGGSTHTGNTLNIDTTRRGISSMNIGNIENFEFINFYLFDSIAANGTILNLNNYANTDLTNSNIIVHINNTTLLNNGDIIHLIQSNNNLTTPKSATLQINNGIVSVSNVSGDFFSISSNMKILDLNFTKNIFASANIKVDEAAKSFLESKLSQSIMISESANLLSENMDNISNLVAANLATGIDLSSFAFAGVGTKKYKTGSSIDQKAVSINAGVAKDFEFGWSGDFLGGVFLEFGASKYKSELDNGFTNKGDAKFFGIGAFGKKMFKNDFYGIIGARIGQAMNKYEDEINAIEYKFDLSNLYYGLNLGGGKLVNLSSSNTLDIYTAYFFAHTNSNEENIGNGLSVEIDAVNSHQISLGAKDNIALDDKTKVYVGASVNYKFGGESKGKLSSNAYGGIFTADIPSPALNGAYFGLDAGCKIAQSQNLNLSIGVKGYLGKEQGVGANLGVEYKF
nr:autotransporter outer membrane beta-barrel domain-containing protein [Campylobacter sp.]